MADETQEVDDANEMLGAGYVHKVSDESSDRKYFIITPRIIKAFSRSPFDLSLWDTVKDIAGDSGECYLTTKDLATLSDMSTGQVSSSRRYWLKLGFLKGKLRRDPGYPQPVWHLTVPDIWEKNIKWCEEHPKILDRLEHKKSVHQVKAPKERSPGEQGLTPGEQGLTPGETKNIHKKKEKENPTPDGDFPVAPRKKDAVDWMLDFQKPAMNLIQAIHQYFPFNVNWKTKTARQWLEWAHNENVTPEQLREAAEVWKSDKRFNWGQPSLQRLFENWPALVGHHQESVDPAVHTQWQQEADYTPSEEALRNAVKASEVVWTKG